MTWEQYYEKFYDWSTSTQINRISQLTSFGPSDQIVEIAQEYMDQTAAERLLRKAVAAGVSFTPEDIYDLLNCCGVPVLDLLLESSRSRFSQEQLEDLLGGPDDDVLRRVAAKNKVCLFSDDEPEEAEDLRPREEKKRSPGLFTLLLTSLLSPRSKQKHGKCDGDCDHCPPHFGYRYGRWYYGHGHTHGCQRGGNCADGRP